MPLGRAGAERQGQARRHCQGPVLPGLPPHAVRARVTPTCAEPGVGARSHPRRAPVPDGLRFPLSRRCRWAPLLAGECNNKPPWSPWQSRLQIFSFPAALPFTSDRCRWPGLCFPRRPGFAEGRQGELVPRTRLRSAPLCSFPGALTCLRFGILHAEARRRLSPLFAVTEEEQKEDPPLE